MIWRIETLESTLSTMDVVQSRAEEGEPEGLVVRARLQTSGRGRWGRTWSSPAGGLYFSVLLRPRRDPSAWSLLSLCASVSLFSVLRSLGAPVEIKWPNDLLLPTGKVAGILLEARAPSFAILGVGLNVSSEGGDLPEGASTLSSVLETPPLPEEILARFLEEFSFRLRDFEEGRDDSIRQEVRASMGTLGKSVEIEWTDPTLSHREVLQGVAVDLDERGRLLVRTERGVVAVEAGDVRLLRTDPVDPRKEG